MRNSNPCFSTRTLALAVRSALLTMAMVPCVQAADSTAPREAFTEQTQLRSNVELGVGYVNSDSYKYGEYNGLFKKGAFAIANVDVVGGGAYDSGDPTRWSIRASDLGLDVRELAVEYGRQGLFWIGASYDELRRNRSDSFQTPYIGAGSNRLTLPSNWIVPIVPQVSATAANARVLSAAVATSSSIVAGVVTPPTAAQLATANAILAADLPAFHNVNLGTERKTSGLGFGVHLGGQWDLKASFSREDKTGLKPIYAISRQTGGDITASIPDLIDQTTDHWDVGVNFTGEKSFLQMGYHGSLYKNNVNGMTWQNWAKLTTPNFNTMSTAPSNEFHQFYLTGGYNFTPTTRLVIDGAYGRSTQNDALLTDATTPVVPISSANALVINRAFNMKLTSRPMSALNLSAAYKFDERDNRTAVNTFQFSDANQAIAPLFIGGGVVAQNANANTPYSKRINRFDADADYKLGKGQNIKGSYQFQVTDRWCNGTWIDCVEAKKTKEHTFKLEYRNHMAANLTGRVGVEHAERDVGNYNENAFLSFVPFANVSPTGAPNGSTAYGTMIANGLNGWGPRLGANPAPPAGSALAFFFPLNNALTQSLYANENRISELPGMRLYNMANRNRDLARASVNWQPREQWDVQAGANFSRDKYGDSIYGLQKSEGWSANLDAAFQVNDDFGITAYFTHEDQKNLSAGNTYTPNSTATNVNGATIVSGGCFATIALRNVNNKIDPCLDWTANIHDRIDTFGIAMKYKGLMAGKLQLSSDVTYTSARSLGTFTGGNYVNNPLAVTGAPAGTVAAFYIPGTPLPAVTTKALNIRLVADYVNNPLAVTGAPAGTVAAYYIPATPLPAVTTKALNIRLVADYAIDKQKTLRFGYVYARLRSVDWAYDGMQYGDTAVVLPSNEKSPNYSVHAFGVSGQIEFR